MSRETNDLVWRRRALGEQLATFRRAAELTQAQLARRIHFDRSRIAHLERGTGRADQRFWAAADEVVGAKGVLVEAYLELETAKQTLAAQERARELAAVRARADQLRAAGSPESAMVERITGPAATEPEARVDRRTVLKGAAAAALGLHDAEALRRQLTADLDQAALPAASLDDWERTVHQYGIAHRYRPAASLLVDLTADFAELRRQLDDRRAILVPTRLTRVVAQMAGLMCATLVRLGRHTEVRNWARTAKVVAHEAGDSHLHAWVLGQEAYSHYYGGHLTAAAQVAAHAQRLAHHEPCTGVALAAALEARVHGLTGNQAETYAALERAESALGGLTIPPTPSTFSYNEAKFAFHTGSAHTHLGNTTAALAAQDQALALCAANDYFDRALIMLDRADCFIRDDDLPAAAHWATRAFQSVSTEQRNFVIDRRTRQVLSHLPDRAATVPAVRDLRELVREHASR